MTETKSFAEMTAKDVVEKVMSFEYEYESQRSSYDRVSKRYVYGDKEMRTASIDGWADFQDWLYGDKTKVIPGLGEAKMVAEFGGEGQGDTYYYVFSVTDGDLTRNFRIDGYYASYAYDGATFDNDDLREVTAQQKTITVWE